MFDYEGMVYRPPSEAESLIIQLTIGCAHNTCTFCNMYTDKRFRIRSTDEVLKELDAIAASPYRDYFRRLFFADGDALCVPTRIWLNVLQAVREKLPAIERVSAYATASDILHKSPDDLRALREAGLAMVYVGAESGDDEILSAVGKDSNSADYVNAAARLHEAGIINSVTLISGLGGQEKLREHARASAKLISAMKPEYCSFLTLSLFEGTPLYDDAAKGVFKPLTDSEVLEEMRLFLSAVDSDGTIFRSNHISNVIALAGTLNKDIPQLIARIEQASQMGYRRPFRTRASL